MLVGVPAGIVHSFPPLLRVIVSSGAMFVIRPEAPYPRRIASWTTAVRYGRLSTVVSLRQRSRTIDHALYGTTLLIYRLHYATVLRIALILFAHSVSCEGETSYITAHICNSTRHRHAQDVQCNGFFRSNITKPNRVLSAAVPGRNLQFRQRSSSLGRIGGTRPLSLNEKTETDMYWIQRRRVRASNPLFSHCSHPLSHLLLLLFFKFYLKHLGASYHQCDLK